MELKTFKKIVGDYLSGKEFLKKGSYYYLFLKELIIVIGFQKSNYSNGYYINIGYIISELNPNLLLPRDVDGDIRARFSIESDGEKIDFFDLYKITNDAVVSSLEENSKLYVTGITTVENLRLLLEKNPIMLYQTKLVAKQFLNLE
ncbi:MAG: DUF4304 domain-containing protein [Chitinophagaceae bacterium]|nr:DUF4304 domain-containing protein [Chitinophagaceae bacterium]